MWSVLSPSIKMWDLILLNAEKESIKSNHMKFVPPPRQSRITLRAVCDPVNTARLHCEQTALDSILLESHTHTKKLRAIIIKGFHCFNLGHRKSHWNLQETSNLMKMKGLHKDEGFFPLRSPTELKNFVLINMRSGASWFSESPLEKWQRSVRVWESFSASGELFNFSQPECKKGRSLTLLEK